MKYLNILVLIFTFIFSGYCLAETQEQTSSVAPIKNIKVESLVFEKLPQKSVTGDLATYVNEKESTLSCLLDRAKIRKVPCILKPYAEGMAYVNGQLCHIGHYPQSIIYTVLEGPYYGLQTTTALDGFVLYVNYEYEVEQTLMGLILHHDYADSEVVTGSNQVILFR